MAKISRNQSCPCGSGKKYKHCCGKTQDLSEYRKDIMENETSMLLERIFHKFANEWYDQVPGLLIHLLGERLAKLPGISQQLDSLFQEPLEGTEAEALELLNEYILFDYEVEPGITIFSRYAAKEIKKMRPMVAEAVGQWSDSYISFYEMIQADPAEETAVWQDVFTGTEYRVDCSLINEGLPLEVGDLMVCRLLNKGESYDAVGMLLLAEGMREDVVGRLNDLRAARMDLLDPWPLFLKRSGYELIVTAFEVVNEAISGYLDELYNIEDRLDWSQEKYREVAQIVRARFTESEYEAEDIYTAIMIWHEYCLEKQPKVTKAEGMAASLEYIINRVTGGNLTQKEVASKYGVSPTTISARANDLLQELARWQMMNEQLP